MNLWLRRTLIATPSMLLAGAVAAAVAYPGPQQMACPPCHKLERIAPRVYVEPHLTAAQRRHALAGIAHARKETARFFGRMQADPQIVVCHTRKCSAIFGSSGAKGVAYGWHAVLLSTSRIFPTIATHELMHAELHWRMGVIGWARGTVPVWFDEGLAVVVSGDPRFTDDATPKAVRDIMQVRSFLGAWSRHARKVGWRTTYAAAATRVRQLERRLGRAGLARFTDELVKNGNIESLLARAERGERF